MPLIFYYVKKECSAFPAPRSRGSRPMKKKPTAFPSPSLAAASIPDLPTRAPPRQRTVARLIRAIYIIILLVYIVILRCYLHFYIIVFAGFR
jgi:hypothetical protein